VSKDLRGQDLSGKDLSGADLRGADLSRANLRDADLQGARTGLGTTAAVGLTVAACAIAVVGGFTASWLGHTIRRALQSADGETQLAGVVLTAELLLCLFTMVWRGTFFTIARVLPPTIALLVLSTVLMVAVGGSSRGLGPAIIAIAVLFVVVLVAVTFARAIAAGVHSLSMVAVVVAWFLGARAASGHVTALLTAFATVVTGMRAASGSETSPLLSRWVRRIATVGGTSFRGADLTGARVADAVFRSTDLRGARFDGVDWNAAREVSFCAFDSGANVAQRRPKRV
jgi:uncharacterized protein YjbI with pentapeptide repeats